MFFQLFRLYPQRHSVRTARLTTIPRTEVSPSTSTTRSPTGPEATQTHQPASSATAPTNPANR